MSEFGTLDKAKAGKEILIAFHNKPEIKSEYVQRLEEHYKLDEIIKGTYWEKGKGCAVGCTVHSASHNCYEIELGIPEWLARLEDTLFEGMPNDKAKEFPLKFLESIPIGFDNWQHIYHQLCVFMLEKICKNIDNKYVVKAICDIITLHKTESKDESAWSAAESAAESAAWSAARSAESAAWSAAWSAARSAESAAWSAESATWSAAESARSAARSAESTARSTESAAWSAAWSAAYKSIADKLLELLEKEK